jgi:DNA-binding transcriptional LysR family regulator
MNKLLRRANLLSSFLAVAREGGIRQAAEKTHLSQSALTRRIQDLEGAIGATLFERTSRGVTLTRFGEALKHHAELIELNAQYALAEITDLVEGGAGELRISGGPAWAYSFVPDAIADLQREFPRVRVSFLNAMNEATLPMVSAGKLDVVLGELPPVAQRNAELRYEPLLQIDRQVYAGRAHPMARRKSVGAGQLAGSPWIALSDTVEGRAQLDLYFRRHRVEAPAYAVETNSIQVGFRMVREAGYLMLLPSTLEIVAAEYGIVALAISGRAIGRYPAGLIYRPAVQRLRAFAVFRERMIEEVRRFRAASSKGAMRS